MALVQFLRGLDANYSKTKYRDGIYFAMDTGHIYLNGGRFGGNSNLKVLDVEFSNSKLTVFYVDGTSKIYDLKELLSTATEKTSGLMSAADKTIVNRVASAFDSDMTMLSVEQAKIISDVKSGKYENVVAKIGEDNILSLKDRVLSATVSLSYDENNKKIVLRGKNNAELGSVDATPFIKDGMLEDVEIVEASVNNPIGGNISGKYIVFTWKIQNGYAKKDWIPAAELFELYTPGDGITIKNQSIGVKVKIGDPYLEVTSDGLSSKGIDSAIITATSTIIGSETDSSETITLCGVKQYAKELVNAHKTAVEELLSAKVDVSEYSNFVQNTTSLLSVIKVTDVDLTETNGISLTKSKDGVIGVSVVSETLVDSLIGDDTSIGPISGLSIKIGEDITIEEKIEDSEETQKVIIGSADSSIQSVIKALAEKVETASAGGIVAIKGDDYISITGSSISKNLSVNISKIGQDLVDGSSALKMNDNGKFSIEWENI